MSTDLLFEQFTTLATAPEGIPRLRELILQLAVQGKLGTQELGDEPASKLLERIRNEKKQFLKERKIPKEKQIEYGDQETAPNFTLPKHWALAHLGELADRIHYGYTASADETNKRIRLLRITDIQNNRVAWDNVPGCEISDADIELYSIKPGDLLVARTGGTVGKSYLVRELPVPAVFASYLIRIIPNHQLNSEYVKLFADSQVYWNQLYEKCMGTGQPNVNGMALRSLLVPLPPLTEQHRIVAKVDRLMALCDELEARQQQERAGCLRLGTASLTALQNSESPEEFERQWAQVCETFDVIFDCPENVGTLRQTILQLAVQGRLVRQEAGDEPASVLLGKIKKEKERLVKEGKTKQDKRLEPITEDDTKEFIPQNWVLTRLGEIAEYNAEQKIFSNEISEDSWVFDLEDIEKDTSRILQKVRFKDRLSLSTKSRFKEGDVLYGKLRPYLNKVVVADEDGYCTTEIVPIRPYLKINSKYLMYALKTPEFLDYVSSKTYGIKMPRLGTADAINTIIPLPPLAEQHRIVTKVDALMALCDALESRLKERVGMHRWLAMAVKKRVAG